MELLEDRPFVKRDEVLRALAAMGLDPLLDAVRHADREDRDLRDRCLSVLSGAGRALLDLAPRLLADWHWAVRSSAAWALGEIGSGDESAVRALSKALEDGEGFVRLHAARALQRLGPAASLALPLLEAVAQNQEELTTLRKAALDAAQSIKR